MELRVVPEEIWAELSLWGGGGAQGRRTGVVPPTEQVLIGPCAGGPERGLVGPKGTGWGLSHTQPRPPPGDRMWKG